MFKEPYILPRAPYWHPADHLCVSQEGLDPKIKSAKEAELKALEQQQQKHQQTEREKRLSTKYHKVRNRGSLRGSRL
jgi:hypothetical protein